MINIRVRSRGMRNSGFGVKIERLKVCGHNRGLEGYKSGFG